MTEKMIRVMWAERPNELELRHLPLQEVGVNDVLIQVGKAGICPWDLRAFSGLSSSVAFPRVLGHEMAGVVAAVGENVKFIKPGQRVVPDMGVKCGVCKACRSGRENRCQNPHFQQFGGGFADYVRVPEKNVHIIKQPSTSLKAAAFTEPLSCVVRGQNMLRLYPGEVELVAGLGPIGLMHLQVAKAFGARVIASDPVQERLVKAKELGADWIVNPKETDVAGMIKDVTSGWGVDAAVVTVGSARLVEDIVPMLAPGGRINIFAGIYPKDQLHIDPNLIHYGEFIITGSADSTPADFNVALNMIESGQVNTEILISHMLPLEELGKGFEIVKSLKGLKVMLDINDLE
ncbi:MAG: threonine dehydrogenase [Chloroflexi bacterium HGW-Chloroflexi-3]|nr:MAG: threonine dehydrogenase [Chloroflexi bacterium HGW-Chloroflexi-3]